MSIIPDFFMNAVVALGIDVPNNKKHWIGTGFIVARKDNNNPRDRRKFCVIDAI